MIYNCFNIAIWVIFIASHIYAFFLQPVRYSDTLLKSSTTFRFGSTILLALWLLIIGGSTSIGGILSMISHV